MVLLYSFREYSESPQRKFTNDFHTVHIEENRISLRLGPNALWGYQCFFYKCVLIDAPALPGHLKKGGVVGEP